MTWALVHIELHLSKINLFLPIIIITVLMMSAQLLQVRLIFIFLFILLHPLDEGLSIQISCKSLNFVMAP